MAAEKPVGHHPPCVMDVVTGTLGARTVSPLPHLLVHFRLTVNGQLLRVIWGLLLALGARFARPSGGQRFMELAPQERPLSSTQASARAPAASPVQGVALGCVCHTGSQSSPAGHPTISSGGTWLEN